MGTDGSGLTKNVIWDGKLNGIHCGPIGGYRYDLYI